MQPGQAILSLGRYRYMCGNRLRKLLRLRILIRVNAKRIDSVKAAVLLLLVLCGAASSFAQNSILRGVVTDESGAVVPNATVTLSGPGGVQKTAITGGDGVYAFVGLTTGDY